MRPESSPATQPPMWAQWAVMQMALGLLQAHHKKLLCGSRVGRQGGCEVSKVPRVGTQVSCSAAKPCRMVPNFVVRVVVPFKLSAGVQQRDLLACRPAAPAHRVAALGSSAGVHHFACWCCRCFWCCGVALSWQGPAGAPRCRARRSPHTVSHACRGRWWELQAAQAALSPHI